MTARTLEEIEALAAEANASGETTRMRVMEFPRLLAIAQEQRAKLQMVRQDINWMLNSRKFLNPDVFDYLDK